MTISTQDSRRSGVVFCDLDAAAAKHARARSSPHLHQLVPTSARGSPRCTAAFRTGGTFLYVPRRRDGRPAAADAHVRRRRRGRGVPAHADGRGARRRGDVHRPLRLARPRRGRFSDAITEIHVGDGAHVRYVAIQDWGTGVTHLAVQRPRWVATPTCGPLRSGSAPSSPAPRPRSSPRRARRLLASSSACSSPTATQHFDHRSIQDHVAPNCTSDLLYKGALRDASRAVYCGLGPRAPRARRRPTRCRRAATSCLSEHAKADAIPNLEIEANDVRCGHAASVGPGRRRGHLLPRVARDPARRGGAADRDGVLPGGAGPRHDRRGPRGRRGSRSPDELERAS